MRGPVGDTANSGGFLLEDTKAYKNDFEKSGTHMLEMLTKFRNEGIIDETGITRRKFCLFLVSICRLVLNGRQATVGYAPEVWKAWQ